MQTVISELDTKSSTLLITEEVPFTIKKEPSPLSENKSMQDLPSNGERGRERGNSRSRAQRSRSPRLRSLSRSRTRSRSPRKPRTSRRHKHRSYSKTSSSKSRSRSRERRKRSPIRSRDSRDRSRGRRRTSRRDVTDARLFQKEPEPSHVLGVFNLSLRTSEKDLQNIFERYGRVSNVTIVYDHRSDRSRGFGFVYMNSVEEATAAKDKTNGMEVNGRNMRVDYSLTQRPHTPTPGEYMGDRPRYRNSYSYRRTPSFSPPQRYRRRSATRSRSRSWSRDRKVSRSRSPRRKRSTSRTKRSRSYSR